MASAYLQSASSGSNLSSFTFSAQNFGAASSDRLIVVAVNFRYLVAGSVTSITIGGVTATVLANANPAAAAASSVIAVAAVPTGTSGSVVVTFSTLAGGCCISLFALTGMQATASDSKTSFAADPTTTISVPAGGSVVGGAITIATTSATWTGLTERADTQATAGTFGAASDDFGSSNAALSVTCDFASSGATSAGAFVSFAPAQSVVPLVMHHRKQQGMS